MTGWRWRWQKEGGVSFILDHSRLKVRRRWSRVKNHKAGFVVSDSNITPDMTLAQVLELVEETGHSTMPVTEDGTANGRLVGMVTSRDYRVSRMAPETVRVADFMTPHEKLIYVKERYL